MQNQPTPKRPIRGERPKITTKTKVYIVILAWILAAVKTIIPFPYVSKPCMLGYKSGCSFAPISTLMLVAGAIITYYWAKKKKIL
ncbi:MAG: hypothetical protein WC325_04380 [Candidatus Bathyarchaeia archaeon]|jgi:NADH:ubiquinone oxidoreductase subunit 3 (subunit A)